MSYIAVIGAGSWGTTLGCLLHEKGYDVSIWAHEKEVADEITNLNRNSIYCPGVSLPEGLMATSGIAEAVANARYIVSVVPTQFIRAVFSEAAKYVSDETVVISASKGIEQGTLLTASEVLHEITRRQVAALSGPSFAKEVMKKLPTAVTLASPDIDTALLLQELFTTGYFRVYSHTDIIGVEIGAALKNVVAIASGICDGLGLGHSARAALITRGLVEITRLGKVMGADPMTFSGLSGLGDLVLTCTGPLSRNYMVGMNLGKGMELSEILSSTRSVAEGVATSLSAFQLAQKKGVEMPIIERVYNVLYKDEDPESAVRSLMNRALKSEF